MCLLFDTHLHLPRREEGKEGEETGFDPEEFLRRAQDAGVERLLLCSSGMEDSLRAADFAGSRKDSSGVFFAAGVHPHDAEDNRKKLFSAEDFKVFAERKGFAAIGEIGLDFYYDFSDRATQISVFRDFLAVALELGVPACVHCRDRDGEDSAYDIAFELLRDFAASHGVFVLHAFAGSPEWADKFIQLGAYFGVGGMITFKHADKIRELACLYPEDRILLETDSPYLAPVPFRGKENHPAYLPLIAEKLTLLRDISLDDCARITTENAFRFLGKRAFRENAPDSSLAAATEKGLRSSKAAEKADAAKRNASENASENDDEKGEGGSAA